MKKKLFSILIIIFLFQIPQAFTQSNYTSKKWELLDIPFEITVKSENPLLVRFGANLLHENGETMNIPGFYNDNNQWIIRFCPPITGKWAFTTYSDLPELSCKKGEITVTENTDPNQHGPVMISEENPKKFVYADGTPYFLLAFELDWLFALDWDNPDGIPKTKQIISTVGENGFNQIIMNVYAYDASWGERDKIAPQHNYAQPNVFPFGGTNEQPDYTTLNIDFFKHLDRGIAHLNEKQIVSHLMIYVWNKKVNWPKSNSIADNLYFDYVVRRYQAFPNLIWDISKEALGYGHNDMNYITQRIERLRKLDGHKRLLSVHDYAYCDAFPEKVDFISIQDWRPNIYNIMLDVSKKHAKKPIFNIEHGGYEKTIYSIFDGAYTDRVACLARNYECIFAGTYSTYYWQNTSWYNIIYDPFSLPEDQQPAFHYYKHLKTLFQNCNFNTLQPTQYTFTTYCLTDNERVYMFYIPEEMIALQGALPDARGKKVIARWYNPLTGKFVHTQDREFKNGAWMHFRKPKLLEGGFAVVVLEVVN